LLPQGRYWQNPVDAPIFLCYSSKRYGVIMSVKLAYLKTGEQVVADIRELVDENEKVVSLVFINPYVVFLLPPEPQLLTEGDKNIDVAEHKVSFSPWIILSSERTIPVNPDHIISLVEPLEWIKKSYTEKMNVSTSETIVNENLKPPSSFEEPSQTIEEIIENMEVIQEETNG
jgi:hypothetical protein